MVDKSTNLIEKKGKMKSKLSNPTDEYLDKINDIVKEYIECQDATACEDMKNKIQTLLAYWFIETTDLKRIGGMFGSIYKKSFDKAIDEIRQKGLESYDLENKRWFTKVFKSYLNKQIAEASRLERNQGFRYKKKKDYVNKCLVEIYKKYGFPLSGRPGAKEEKDDGLNVELVEFTLHKLFHNNGIAEEIEKEEISRITNIINNTNVNYDATEFSSSEDDDNLVSMADKQTIDSFVADQHDARRFIVCCEKFYNKIKEKYSNSPAKMRDAKRYITFNLFLGQPSNTFIQYIQVLNKMDIIDEAWFKYLQEYSPNDNKSVAFADVLVQYVNENRLQGKINKNTAGDYYREIDKFFKSLMEKGTFSKLKY